MLRTRSLWITIMAILAIIGLLALTGCGPSKEKQQMSGFISEYGQAVDTFAELTKKTDTNGISESKAKIESFKSQWSDMKIDLASEITPQDLNELDDEFKVITKKYQAIAANA
jgi:hypothetical protein